MNGFSRNGIENFNDASGFCPAKVDPYNTNPGIKMESELWRALYDAEFDRYSDVSVDTSSGLSLDSSEYVKYGNQKSFRPEMRSLGDSEMQFGYTKRGGTLSPPSCSNSSRYSDDETSELLFDQAVTKMMDEQEELLYQLVHRDEYWENRYSRTAEDAYWNMEPTPEARDFFFPNNTLIWDEDDSLNRETRKEEISKYLYQNKKPIRNQTMKPVNNMRKHLENHPKALKLQYPTYARNEGYGLPTNQGRAKPFACDVNSISEGEQRIFLGGLPAGLTERTLRQHLAARGYKVLKRPKILRGFAPEVWMRSPEQARELVARGTIMIEGVEVEIRPYNSLTKLSALKKIPKVGKRSVFLGGLPSGTTAKDIQNVLRKKGMGVVNYPTIRNGFSRQVILESISQASTLIKMKRIWVNGAFVDVRPFVNQLRRKKTH